MRRGEVVHASGQMATLGRGDEWLIQAPNGSKVMLSYETFTSLFEWSFPVLEGLSPKDLADILDLLRAEHVQGLAPELWDRIVELREEFNDAPAT